MAFKMKRAGMSLRSSTSIQPKLTNIEQSSPLQKKGHATPFKQIVEAIEISQDSSGKPVDTSQITRGENLDNSREEGSGEGGGGSSPGCGGHTWASFAALDCPSADDPGDPCLTCANEKCKNNDFCKSGGVGRAESTEEESMSRIDKGVQGPRTNILSPRSMRRNERMLRKGSQGDERNIKLANRNIRQAIRRGKTPNENDLAIISGQALGNYDGLNTKQDQSAYDNWFTGQKVQGFQTMPGGEVGPDVNYNDQLKTIAEELYAANPDLTLEQLEKESMDKLDKDIATRSGDTRVQDGKYLSRRTRNLMESRDVDTSKYGDYGKRGKSQKRKDRDARKVTGLTDKLKSASKGGKFDPDNEAGISRSQYDRTKRKSKKRGGDVSAFKKKGSPMHMTVNVTKPSYKMGGFGSK
jgi:hypothetical protein